MTDTTSNKPPVSLSSLMTPSKTVTLEFPGYMGLNVDLCYLAREELLKLRKKCLNTKFNRCTPIDNPIRYPIKINHLLEEG